MNLYDPNTALGDLQLMAIAFWLSHEEKRVVEIQKIMARELSEPLMIREEPEDPSTLIYSHRHLADNPHIAPDYVERLAQATAHFEDMERLFGDNCIHACTRRWNTLSHSLKIREYHSPTKMRKAMRRVPILKKSMQNLKSNWIGLKFNPPLLLGLLEGSRKKRSKDNGRK